MKKMQMNLGIVGSLAVTVACLATSGLAQQADTPLRYRNLTVSPYVSLSGAYDSNIDAAPENERDDYSAILELGANFRNHTRLCHVEGRLWGLAEEYQEYDAESHQDYGNALKIRLWDRHTALLVLEQSFEDRTDTDIVTGSIEGWRKLEASALLGKDLTDKLGADLAYRYRGIDYDAERLYDFDQHTLDLLLGQDMTERSVGTLLLRGGRQQSDANAEDADFVVAHIGFKTRNSRKLRGALGVGWHYHDVEDPISTPSADIALRWQPRQRIAVDLNTVRTVEPSRQNMENYNVETRTTLALHVKPVDDITLSAIGMFARNDYDRPVTVDGVERDKADDTLTGILRCAWRPTGEKLELVGDIKLEERDSTLDANDYEALVVSLGARLWL